MTKNKGYSKGTEQKKRKKKLKKGWRENEPFLKQI